MRKSQMGKNQMGKNQMGDVGMEEWERLQQVVWYQAGEKIERMDLEEQTKRLKMNTTLLKLSIYDHLQEL
ncbi:hypothetical protein STEG23_036987 [Scotinomys teguina]